MTPAGLGCLGVIGALIALWIIGNISSSNHGTQETTATSSPSSGSGVGADVSTAPSSPAPPPVSCVSDWTVCKDNADLVNNNIDAMVDAKMACKDRVAAQANYGDPKWCSGWFCQDFDKFRAGDDAPKMGILTIVDDELQLQNGFGAWVHVEAICTYDLKNKAIITLNLLPRNENVQ